MSTAATMGKIMPWPVEPAVPRAPAEPNADASAPAEGVGTEAAPRSTERIQLMAENYELLMALRRARLAEVDALEQALGIMPRTATLRKAALVKPSGH